MKVSVLILLVSIVVVGYFAAVGCRVHQEFNYMTKPLAKITDSTESSRKLVELTKHEYLTKEVLQVTDNIYVAIGYALANSIMIVGDNGIIIVDTTESQNAMKEILVEYRKITNKPVTAIIFTHFHSDHILGTSVIIEAEKVLHPNNTIDIYAHETTLELMVGFSATYDVGLKRGIRQMGTILPKIEGMRTGSGIGPELRTNTGIQFYIPEPTVTYKDHAAYTVSGVEFELIHTPGETDDQTTVWIPNDRVILPGDNIYKTFPNIYAIRGSPARNAVRWYQSLDRVRALRGEYLIGSHTQPVVGEEAVEDTLLIYRDAIKYVHDQTVRLLNKGYYVGEIVRKVRLPDNVARHPHLQEHYGSVPWSVRGVFAHYLGWFSGDPKELDPMKESVRALKMRRLVSFAQTRLNDPVEVLLQEAQRSHEKSYQHYQLSGRHLMSDDKWALELADTVLAMPNVNEEHHRLANLIKISALRAIGIEHVSPNGRNYYLTFAMEMEHNISLERTKQARAFAIRSSTVEEVLATLCLKVKGRVCQHKNYTIDLEFPDIDQTYAITLRNSVCDVLKSPEKKYHLNVKLSTSSEKFKAIKAEDVSIDEAVAAGDLKVIYGNLKTYKEFLKCFDPVNSI